MAIKRVVGSAWEVGHPEISSWDGGFDASYTDHGIWMEYNHVLNIDLSGQAESDGGELWIAFVFWAEDYSVHYDSALIEITDSSGNDSAKITMTDANMTLTLYANDGTSATDTPTITFPQNTVSRFCLRIWQDGADAKATLYSGLSAPTEVASITMTGKTNRGGKNILLKSPSTHPDIEMILSEIIIADEDISGARLKTLRPSATVSGWAWTGSHADVDEFVSDDNAISASAAGAIAKCDHAETSNANAVRAVVLSALAAADGSSVNGVLGVNGADYDAAPLNSTPASLGLQQTVWDVNPDDSAAFDAADINALEFGVKKIG